ncbi:MAG: dynamin family protein [Candidatus Micrarchaeota archaeon]|nr:dynamin family protein [Candidatus Micrarchaeota archaeon]
MLLEALSCLSRIEPSWAGRAEKIGESLEGGFFTLAVMGQVKRGKTTIANALLGEPLLPVDTLPLTSIVTCIRYGKGKRFTVSFADGSKREISAAQITDYITEDKNPKNEKKVERVEIEHPSAFLSLGVMLVDTPGIGSVHLHNTEITHRFLPEVDAALFTLSPDPPITEAECAFLAESAKFASKFFFALTKSDYLPKKELAKLVAFNRSMIAQKIGLEKRKVKLYTFSAKQALEAKKRSQRAWLAKSGFSRFETALRNFVVRQKGWLVLGSSAAKTAHLAQETLNQRLIEKSSMCASAEELEGRLRRFEAELQRAHSLKEKLDGLIELEQRKIMEGLDEDLEGFKRTQAPLIVEKVLRYAEGIGDCGNEEFNRAVEEFRSQCVLEALGSFRDLQEQKISQEFSRRIGAYSASVDEIIAGMEKAASEIFKVRIRSAAGGERLALESNFYFKLSREGQDTDSPGIELALPRFMFRKRKMQRVERQVREDLEINAGRMRYDFLSRMRKSADAFKFRLSDKIDAVADGIRLASRRALESQKEGGEGAQRRLEKIDRDISELGRLISVCRKIESEVKK